MMTDGYIEQMLARRKRRIRIALRVAAAAALVAFVVWAPGCMIERAHKGFVDCSNADYETAPNPKTDCSNAKLWLLFPKIVPWKRGEALKESRKIDRDSADRLLTQATTFAPNADAQARAIATLARARTDGDLGAESYAAILAVDGVAWRIGAERDTFDNGSAQSNYFRQTLQRGSIDDAFSFARSGPKLAVEDYSARDLYFRRGALLCLSGQEAEGRAAFHDAMRINAQHHDFPFHEARIGLAACGEITNPKSDDLDRDALWSFQLGADLIGGALEDRLIGPYGSQTIREGNESPFVAAAIAERERSMEETLKLVAALSRTPVSGLSPWPWETPYDGYAVLVDPQRDEHAAERLEAVAKTAPEKQEGLGYESRMTVRLPASSADRFERIWKAPAAAFRAAARGYWVEAAGTWSRMGHCDRAEADGRRIQPLGPTAVERLYLSAALIRCGSFDAAGEVAKGDDGEILRAVILADIRIQALAHAGKWAEALAMAKDTARRTVGVKKPADEMAQLFDDGPAVVKSTDWLLLALSYLANDMSAAPAIETPEIYEREKRSWKDFIALPESERAVLRWRMREIDTTTHPGAHPAQLFVVGKAANDGVEVWLDKIAFSYNPTFGGVPSMRARAEAARWRGDAKAEADWLGRAAAVEKLLTDPRKLALAKLAGL